ncbi:endolytic transglycosylase MltG [Candidatus Gottesmanbacteria bacterium]|nr:endolytic transglycosylase MltG [Candidatus Gottesmanbacteria bacterium]
MKKLLLLLLPLIAIFIYIFGPTGLSKDTTRFVVPLESKQETIINDLKNKGFIRSEKAFSLLLYFIGPQKKIEPGSYLISHSMNSFQLADTLLNHPYQVWAVLIPGLRVEQIGEKLQKKLKWSDGDVNEFLHHAQEGYMFPDTYLFPVEDSPKMIADRMISNFNEKFDRRLQADLLSQNVRNDTAIKIASLIERESGTPHDKGLIAGVIWNRLNKGMCLQIDATIQYAIGKPGNWWPIVKGSDLKIDSPYNTYKISALPPGPIANPSLASIRAAVYPEETDCFYYLHTPDKKIHCSETYKEHLENIELYLK